MADDDNFDIDIYGDDSAQDYNDSATNNAEMAHDHSTGATLAGDLYEEGQDAAEAVNQEVPENNKQGDVTFSDAPPIENTDGERQQISSTGGSAHDQVQAPKQAPVQQGTKRKEGPDDRPTDPGATAALQIQDLHWWICEDDIRGWANQAGCEDELKDVTFNEHKVNGKSKGQVFIEMTSPQAATALKHRVDSFGSGPPHTKKYAITYHIAEVNPFRTHPKEVPNRKDRESGQRNTSSFNSNSQNSYNQNMHGGYNGMQNNYRGRGGYNQNRGNMGYNNQRNFSGPLNIAMGNQGFGGGMGGFGNNMAGNVNMGMGGMGQFNNFNRGGGMMGGVRGGMQNHRGRGNMMGAMSMGIGGMGGMGGMGMGGMMGGGMQGGFGNNQHFNPAFFNQNQQGNGDWNSQHPAKRQRAE